MAAPAVIDTRLRKQIVDHALKAIETTPFLDSPFPHVLISNFLPSDVYTRLLRSLPPDSAFEAFSYEKHSNQAGESNRKRFSLRNAQLDLLPSDSKAFWLTVRSVLGGPELKTAIFGKLSTGLAFRYRCRTDEAVSRPGYALPEIFRETESYRIAPHPDTRKKVVTMQMSLARDDSQKDLGTEFYRRSLNPGAWFREPKGFDIVKTMPFLPNTAYAFVVLNTITLKSWHGRSTLQSQCGLRESILNIWYEKAEHANPEILEDLQGLSGLAKAA